MSRRVAPALSQPPQCYPSCLPDNTAPRHNNHRFSRTRMPTIPSIAPAEPSARILRCLFASVRHPCDPHKASAAQWTRRLCPARASVCSRQRGGSRAFSGARQRARRTLRRLLITSQGCSQSLGGRDPCAKSLQTISCCRGTW